MIDNRFYKLTSAPLSVKEISSLIDAQIEGEHPEKSLDKVLISSIAPLSTANSKDLTFLSNLKYLQEFENTKAGACIVPHDFLHSKKDQNIILLKSKNPYFSYQKAVDLFYKPQKQYKVGIMPSAVIAESAKIGADCYIGHNVVIEDNVIIGDHSIIESGSYIDYGVIIGVRAKINPNVTISYCRIGDDVVILPGVRIGQDGFGFATNQGVHHKIFHTGLVIIGHNVEIGANAAIDRGSMSNTIIEDLCRIGNAVQIAHNVILKKGTIIAAQGGVAGSTHIGCYTVIGGQVGFSGHLVIGDYVQIAGGSGVINNLPDRAKVGGYPAIEIRNWHRQTIVTKNLISKRKNASP